MILTSGITGKSFFELLGMDDLARTQWTASENVSWTLLFAYCFGIIGYYMLIWMSGIERINPEL